MLGDMEPRHRRFCLILISLMVAFRADAQPPADPGVPHLEKRGSVTHLIVDGRPFLVLAGELENNSATSLEYMSRLWAPLKKLHLNTVLAAVSWAMLEPTEGKFDFALLDGPIRDARDQKMRLVLLWFGSWKNLGRVMLPIGSSAISSDSRAFNSGTGPAPRDSRL